MTAPPGPPFEDRPSPNRDARGDAPVDILLLHYTGMPRAGDALDRLCDPAAKVSSHWFVHEDGRIVRLVDETDRAWHAGVASWAGARDVNARSIGIEIDNPGHEHGYRDFPDAQVAALVALSRAILARHPIPPRRVLAHSDVAPGRKVDPGERFPWDRLHAAGIGHWVPPVPPDDGPALAAGDTGKAVRAAQARLSAYGYGIAVDGTYGPRTTAVVDAFQRHFRPVRVDGRADASTLATLDALIAG